MIGLEILIGVVALLVIVAALTVVSIRHRRAGGVLIADGHRAGRQRRRQP